MTKIDFQFETKYGLFADALYLSDNESFTEEEIQVMKQARLDNWINAIENPPIEQQSDTVEIDGVTYIKAE